MNSVSTLNYAKIVQNYRENVDSMILIINQLQKLHLKDVQSLLKTTINQDINNSDLIFSRITSYDKNNICYQCKRSAIYIDNNDKLYCWFHRSEKE